MFVGLLFLVVIYLYAFWVWKVHFKRGHKLPPVYPGLLPILGHLHILIGDGKSLFCFLKDVAAEAMKKGGVICLFYGTQLYYVIVDPDDALTAANACLQKHCVYDYAKPWLGDGLITASGEIWRRHRKLLAPAFSSPVMHGFLDIFNQQSRVFVDNLKQEVGKRFDHTVYLRSSALETFCLTSFGITGFENEDFIKKYMHAADKILKILALRFQNFWLQSDLIFKICGLKKKQDKYVKILNDMSDKVIKRKRAAKANNFSEHATPTGFRSKPFLNLLLELSEDNALTDKEIREEVDTAIVAGSDTISSVLTYIMILLGTHPTVQEKMYKEISEILPTDRDVEKEDFNKLVYTEAIIKESLRVYTVAPVTLRYVAKDVKLKNYTIRAGSQCILLLYGTHRDPVWGTDADQFRPERWLSTNMQANPTAFVGFSLGKRSCLGKTYAMISMKTTLVHFLRRYKIIADDSNLVLRLDFFLKPVSGHEISIEERI